MGKEHNMGRIRKGILCLLFIVAASGLVFAISRLVCIYSQYQKGVNAYEQLEDKYIRKEKKPQNPAKRETDETENPVFIDFDGLQAVNPDVVGWIELPGLELGYPLLQGEDNTYYLKHLANRETGINGSIFVDYHNQADFSDKNTIIYGHNMKDGSMFGTLDHYNKKAIYQKEPYFYIYLRDRVLEYEIISCYAGSTGSSAYTYEFPTEKEFSNFLEQILSASEYDTGVSVGNADRVVTLSTCVNTNRNYRYLVHGVLKQERKME